VKTVRGRAWVFGDDVNTDVMAPGLYFKSSMDEMARHCLETVNPDFARQVRPGDIVVAGRNFGVGSAREQAAMALAHLGVGAVPALFFEQAREIGAGAQLELDPVAGWLHNLDDGREYRLPGIPPHLMAMVEAGGLMPWLKQRLGQPGSTPPEKSAEQP
jgi:3-isopropylmalate/(R)-2-methylmalate dehydratase small subunit